jgi:hypothetical protein
MATMLVEAPASDGARTIEKLGYVEAYDAVLNCDYAYVVYRETDKDSGAWRVRVKSSQTTGVVFEPEAMRLKAREAGAQGKAYFTWGAGMDPSAGDQRQVEFRVHQEGGKASAVEVYVRMRKFDGTGDEAKSVKVKWPA